MTHRLVSLCLLTLRAAGLAAPVSLAASDAGSPPAGRGKAAKLPSAAMASESGRGTQTKDAKPQIITDEKTNTVRILIGGKEILLIDAKGLHVNGDLTYTGVEVDAGEEDHAK